MTIDELDARLIATLRANPRVGLLEVARQLGVARGTAQARVTPDKVNPAVAAVPCGAAGGVTRALPSLRVVMHFHGHRQLRVAVRHVHARRVLVTVRRGTHLLLRRRLTVKRHDAHLQLTARRPGTYRVTAVDPGPPLRTARAKRRIH